MLVFNNQQRTGYEEIVSYGPCFYQQIKEMDAIYRFAGWTSDLMAADLERLMEMQFIKYMDNEMLTRYENFIGIERDYSKTLEERRTIVSATSNKAGKLSKGKIQSIVNSFVECDCRVSLKESVLVIEMIFRENPALYMNSIRELIQDAIPAHIGIVYRGGIDISIAFKWDSKVSVQRMIHKMTFRMHTAAKDVFLDGSAVLDGSCKLDKSLHVYPVNMACRGIVRCNEFITGPNMKLRYRVRLNKEVGCISKHTLQMKNQLTTKFSVFIKNENEILRQEEL